MVVCTHACSNTALAADLRRLTASALLKMARALHPTRARAFHDRLVDDVFNTSEAQNSDYVTLEEFKSWVGTKYSHLLLSWFGAWRDCTCLGCF